MSYRRVKRVPSQRPSSQEITHARQELQHLRHEHERGAIDLRYLDEVGFSLQPVIPYAWQRIATTITLPATDGRRLSVIGLLSPDNVFDSYVFEGYANSQLVIATLDAFVETIEKPTVVVLDNASIHTAKAVERKRADWEHKGLRLQFLPTYSPQLNIIEILWKHLKYYWLPFDAYTDFQTLYRSVCSVLKHIGSKYRISFA